jgi:hypothetical protein
MDLTANWEIRVGGEYKAIGGEGYRKVTAIDGETVYFDYMWRDSDKIGHSSATTAQPFRNVSLPEDLSTYPAITALLEKIIDVSERGAWQPEGRYLAYEAREILAGRKVSA